MSTLQLNILGKFEARMPSGKNISLPTRKAEVLLTYLALMPGKSHPRERLANLLWSDRSEDQARNSLRQILSAIKKALDGISPSPLQIERTDVHVTEGSIAVDALEMEHLIKERTPEAAVQAIGLYQGEFLDGLVIQDANTREWLAGERDRYRRMAVQALENLLSHQLESTELDKAVETGERLVDLDPLNESAWRQLMRVYAADGERNHALMAYKRCFEFLESELEVEPGEETKALHDEIRDGTLEASSTQTLTKSDVYANRSPSVAAGLPIPASSTKPSIVVLPFSCLTTDSEDDYFADGLTQDIIANLCRYRELFVIDHNSAFALRDASSDTENFGNRLGVKYLAKGNVRRSGDQVRISAQLIETNTGKTMWADHLDRKFDELFALEDEVATLIATRLVGHIESESSARALRKHPENMTAFDCVIRARPNVESYDHDQNASARRLLEKAIKLDPDYAAAYAYLAFSFCVESESPWCMSRHEAIERAIAYAQKAVSLDEFDSDAHVAMGWAYMYQKKYGLAETHLDRAIECNPNDYGAFCVKSWLLSFCGRGSEVALCVSNALHLNPLAPDNCLLGMIIGHYTQSNYHAALEMLARVQEPDANSEAWRAACLAQLGRDEEATVAAANAKELGGSFIRGQDWLHLWAFKNSQDLDHFIDGLNKSGVLG
jgi:TolB-like protein/DNA-binding SARP family transcriptional activator